MKRYGFLSIALAAAITLGCNSKNSNEANSANPPAGGAVGTAGSESVKSGDKDFVHDLAIANTAEVELGRMAAERAANPEVKQFAQMMVDDHTKANTELMAIASQHNVPAPNELDDKHRDLRDKLAKYQGMEFDREYIDAMVDGHGDVVDKLGSASTRRRWTSGSRSRKTRPETSWKRRARRSRFFPRRATIR